MTGPVAKAFDDESETQPLQFVQLEGKETVIIYLIKS